MHNRFLLTAICLIMTTLGACVMPASTQWPPSSSAALTLPADEKSAEAIYTAAVATEAARITPSASIEAIASPASEVTATPLLISPPTQAVTATKIPPETATNAPTATATSKPLPTYPSQDLGTPTWYDPLENGSNWPLYEDEHSRFIFKDGKLLLAAKNLDWWDGWMLTRFVLKNFYLEANFKNGTCAGFDRYGLVFRAPNANQGYLFGVSCNGHYSLRLWDGSQTVSLQGWTPSNQINQGSEASNRLRIKAEGNHITLFINGSQIAAFNDSSSLQGQFGLFVGAEKTANFEVIVDQIAYWELP